MAAEEIEALVVKSVRDHLKLIEPIDDRTLVNVHVQRIEIRPEELIVQLVQGQEADPRASIGNELHIPWRKTPSKRRREILLPEGPSRQTARPIRSETRATLVASIARGRRWLDELTADARTTTEKIAEREGCSLRKVNMTISLAFLAPALVKAAIDGRLPRGVGVTRLFDLPADLTWVSWTKLCERMSLERS